MIFFIFGLFWGSFLNNIAFRLEKGEDYLFSRSKCPNCGNVLGWKELIPIISFLWQKGKCRHCQVKISWRYPLVEIFTGSWTYLLALSLQTKFTFLSLLQFIFYFIFLSILFVLALYDWKTFFVDDHLVFLGISIFLFFYFFKGLYFNVARDFSFLLNYFFTPTKLEPFISALVSSSLFLFFFLITKGQGMGFGDVKVSFLIGLFLKLGDSILSIMLASFLGSIYGLYLTVKNKKFKQPLPFVPFLFLGVLATIFFGNNLTKFYFDFLKI
jgi:leader peptidase (prepilin peptidase)/N-methyltransferase